MNFARLSPLVLCLVIAGWSPARAEEGFDLSKLNPFAKKDDETRFRITDEPEPPKGPPKLQLPKFQLPKWNLKSQRDPTKPTGWEKFSEGTKNFFDTTKETLAPWSKPKRRTPEFLRPGAGGIYPGRADRRRKKSIFPWFQREEEVIRPQTVPEFLDQPRPDF